MVGDGLRGGTECYPTVCGNGILEKGEECDTHQSPSCCDENCHLQPSGFICRNTTIVCDITEYCNGTDQYHIIIHCYFYFYLFDCEHILPCG